MSSLFLPPLIGVPVHWAGLAGGRARHMAAYANNHTIDSGCSSAIPSDAASDILAVFDSFLPPTMAHLADYVAPPVMHTLCRPTRRSFDGPRALFVCLLFVDALVCFRWLKDSCLWLLTFVALRERIIELEAVRDLVTGLETVISYSSCLLSLLSLKCDLFLTDFRVVLSYRNTVRLSNDELFSVCIYESSIV